MTPGMRLHGHQWMIVDQCGQRALAEQKYGTLTWSLNLRSQFTTSTLRCRITVYIRVFILKKKSALYGLIGVYTLIGSTPIHPIRILFKSIRFSPAQKVETDMKFPSKKQHLMSFGAFVHRSFCLQRFSDAEHSIVHFRLSDYRRFVVTITVMLRILGQLSDKTNNILYTIQSLSVFMAAAFTGTCLNKISPSEQRG